MDKDAHTVTSIIFLTFLWFIVKFILQKDYFWWVFILMVIPVAWAPDYDQAFNMFGHRNIGFHSIGLPIYCFYLTLQYDLKVFSFYLLLHVVIVGIHCLCDIRLVKTKRRGFYTIKILQVPSISIWNPFSERHMVEWKTKIGLNGFWSTVWLVLNFIVAITILGAWLYHV